MWFGNTVTSPTYDIPSFLSIEKGFSYLGLNFEHCASYRKFFSVAVLHNPL